MISDSTRPAHRPQPQSSSHRALHERYRPKSPVTAPMRPGMLAWSARRRVMAVLPILISLWLAVAWAQGGLAS